MTHVHRLIPLVFIAACSVKSGIGGSALSSGSNGPSSRGSTGSASRLPGGDLVTAKGDPCTSARNHCLRDMVWFVGDPFNEEGARSGRVYGARAVFERDGVWWTWTATSEEKPAPAYRTVAATRQAPAVGDVVIFFSDRYAPLPDTEHTAHFSSSWTMGYATAVDGDSVQVGNQDVALESARVVVETR